MSSKNSNIGKRSAGKIKLDSYEDLFGNDTSNDSGAEQIKQVALSELHTFLNHPFRVVEDEAMQELIESIQTYGGVSSSDCKNKNRRWKQMYDAVARG